MSCHSKHSFFFNYFPKKETSKSCLISIIIHTMGSVFLMLNIKTKSTWLTWKCNRSHRLWSLADCFVVHLICVLKLQCRLKLVFKIVFDTNIINNETKPNANWQDFKPNWTHDWDNKMACQLAFTWNQTNGYWSNNYMLNNILSAEKTIKISWSRAIKKNYLWFRLGKKRTLMNTLLHYQFENQDGKKSQAIVMNSNIKPELCKRQ